MTITLVVLAFSAPIVSADEGMWLPHALDKAPVAAWQARGLEMDALGLYNPKGTDVSDAVVRVGGGTGSFVSADGLIVTNHHVAAGALQRASTVDANYLEDGFVSNNREEEIPALGYEAYVLMGVENVTKQILKKVKDSMAPAERAKAIELAQKQLVEKVEKGKDIYADVSGIYGDSEFYLYTYLKIKDVRIVYAPPRGIGVFGGDIDNWMWPRHTGDFAFLRAYVGPDGKSAVYAKENVPYRPRNFLPFSTNPLEEGDFTMVIGYPGSTRRHRSSYAIDHYVNAYYPRALDRYEQLLAIFEDEAGRDPQAKIKLASNIQGLNNGYKNNQGMLEGLRRHHLLDQKRAQEKELRETIASDAALEKEYGDLFPRLEAAYAEYSKQWEVESNLGYMLYITSALRTAYTIYNWSVERDKSDTDRDASYMPRDEERLRRSVELADRRYFEHADKRVMGYFIRQLADAPIPPIREVCGDLRDAELEHAIQEFVETLYAGTQVTNKEASTAMFGKSTKELMSTGDPMIKFAAALEAEMERREEMGYAFEGTMQELRPRLIALRAIHEGGAIYPDANRTMRISTGAIKGYSPRDAVTYGWLTTLGGVIEKETGEEPFDSPERLITLYEKKDFGSYADPVAKDVPVNFLTTDDITGGNSGSAVLNGRGEIIGLAFDGNLESVSSDYQFLPDLTRCIGVDSRYILFVLDKFSGAQSLLSELTVEHHASR